MKCPCLPQNHSLHNPRFNHAESEKSRPAQHSLGLQQGRQARDGKRSESLDRREAHPLHSTPLPAA